MEYVVKHAFKGAVDGEVYPRNFKPGDIITGDLGLEAYNGGLADRKTKPKKRKSSGRKGTDKAAS